MPITPVRRFGASLTLLTLLTALNGCGGSADPGSIAGKQDGGNSGKSSAKACELLTAEEIGAATNTTADAGKSSSGDQACKWVVHGPEDADGGVSSVSIDVLDEAAYPGSAPGAAVPVSGVGDSALWAAGLFSLYVHAGTHAFSVQVVLLKIDQQAAAKELAGKVVARL